MKSHQIRILLYFYFVFVSSFILGQNIDSRILNLKSLRQNQILDSAKSIYDDILQLPHKNGDEKKEMLLQITKKLDIESYLMLLGNSIEPNSANPIQKLDSIYALAKENGIRKIMGWALARKGEFFKEMGLFDSSMVNILRAKDIFTELNDKDKLVSVKHTLADLYFAGGDYPKAKKMYLEIEKAKGYINLWETWRKRTIRNNLALIDIEYGNYSDAIQKFNKSLLELKKRSKSRIDSIAQAYIYSELAKIYLVTNNDGKFLNSFKLGISPALKYNQHKFAAELFFAKSKYFNKIALKDSTLKYLLLAEKFADKAKNPLKLLSNISTFQANYFLSQNDFRNSAIYLNKSLALNDSLIKSQMMQKHMQLLAKVNYNNIKNKYDRKTKEFYIAIFAAIFITLTLSIILILYFRLQKANKILVKKILELDSVEEKKDCKKTTNLSLSEPEMIKIAQSLELLMKEEKLFLNKDISIEKLAKLLETNRTYLSKSINEITGSNFSTYISNLRIKEAIHLIKSGYLEKYSIEGIGDKCGFKSRSAFFKAFKLYTDVSPSFFIKNLEN